MGEGGWGTKQMFYQSAKHTIGINESATASRVNASIDILSQKIKYIGTLKYDFRKKLIQDYLQAKYKKFDQVVAEMQFSILTGSRS